MSERVSNILELPHEILVSIILYLNARERLSLSRACQKFNTLVFEDADLLRDLDFSQSAHLTTLTHIREYLENKNTHKYLRRLNVSHVECIKTGYLFYGSLGTALNLVDINMHGITFNSISQLGVFLNSQQHLRRLSFNWSGRTSSLCCKVLRGPFSRLRYLSVELRLLNDLEVFMPCLLQCEKLQELRVVANLGIGIIQTWKHQEPKVLKNLRIIEYCGTRAKQVKQDFVPILEDPQQWAALQFEGSRFTNEGFYLGIFSAATTVTTGLALNKRMMKNPRYQVSCLNIEYNVEKECVVHLIASAFPNMTKLVLSKRAPSRDSVPKDAHCERRLKTQTGVVVEEHKKSLNVDPVFKKLVEHTPHLKKLIILGNAGVYLKLRGTWDLETLYSITGWKNLTNLELSRIPLDDGRLLIAIGQECRNLETLDVTNPTKKSCIMNCFYDKELAHMSTGNCKLQKFSFEAILVADIAAVFHSLANHPKLKKVTMRMFRSSKDCVSSEELLRYTCSEITTFACHITGLSSDHADILKCALTRLKEQLHIPCFRIAVAKENTINSLCPEEYELAIYLIL